MSSDLRVLNQLNYDDLQSLDAALYEFIHDNLRIKPGDRVAIKPNLLGPYHPDQAATTHPELLRCVIKSLLPYGCEILLCEDMDDESILEKCGVDVLLKEYGLAFYNLRDYGYVSVNVSGIEYQYAKLLLSCDHLIQVPKFKTHMLTDYSGAIKNMYGCISKLQRKELHKIIDSDGFADILCSIYSIRMPDLVIMDAVLAMEGMGPSFGNPKYLGKVAFSTDGVLVDRYMTSLVGYDPDELQMLNKAFEKGISSLGTDEKIGEPNVDTCADFVKLPVYQGRYKRTYLSLLKRATSINYDLCIGCGKCKESCPFDAIAMDGCQPVFESKKCMLCFCCFELCPVHAITTRINEPFPEKRQKK